MNIAPTITNLSLDLRRNEKLRKQIQNASEPTPRLSDNQLERFSSSGSPPKHRNAFKSPSKSSRDPKSIGSRDEVKKFMITDSKLDHNRSPTRTPLKNKGSTFLSYRAASRWLILEEIKSKQHTIIDLTEDDETSVVDLTNQ